MSEGFDKRMNKSVLLTSRCCVGYFHAERWVDRRVSGILHPKQVVSSSIGSSTRRGASGSLEILILSYVNLFWSFE